MAAGQATELRARGLADLKAAHLVTDDAVKRQDLYRSSLAKWLSTAKTPEDWTAVTQNASDLGIPKETIAEFGEWAPDAPARAADMVLTPSERTARIKAMAEANEPVQGTSEEANTYRMFEREARERKGEALTAQEKGAIWARARSVTTSAASKEGMDSAEKRRLTKAVLDKPSIWRDLTQTVKSAIAADLYEKDFRFPAPENDGAERWRQTQRSVVQKEFRETGITAEERDLEFRRIEDSYRIQTGQDPLTEEQWQTSLRTSRPPSPPPTPGPTPTFGTGSRPTTGAGQRPQSDIQLPAGPIPADITGLLKGQKPGKYKMDDGTIWQLSASGAITQVN
jgi:hypothetical protein